MSVTPNYGWPLVATNQASPEVTHNAAMVEIDDALGGLFSHAMSDADYTLNTAAVPSEAGHLIYKFTGTLTANRNIIVPSNKKLYVVWNNTTTPHTLTVKMATGTGVSISYSATASYTMVYCDGTDVVLVGMAGPQGDPGSYADPTINAQTGSNYDALLGDDGNVVTMNYGSACTFTLNSGVFPVGATLTIIQLGAGQVTLVNGNPSVLVIHTPSSLTARAQYSTVSLVQVASAVWVAAGDLT